MSIPTDPAAPAAKPRPTTVTISSYLLFLIAALQVIGLVIALSIAGTVSEVFEEAYAGTEMAEGAGAIGVASTVVAAVVGTLVAVGLVVLAILNNRGKNASRIVTWVLGGLYLCCGGMGLIMQAAGGLVGVGGTNQPGAPDPGEVQRTLEERLPGWYTPVTTTLSAITFIALLVALILLALPASNEFFRKQQGGWAPPTPGAAYPGYPQPGYPQTPQGHPQTQPGYPQGQPQPGQPPASPPAPSNEPPATPPGESPAPPGEPPRD